MFSGDIQFHIDYNDDVFYLFLQKQQLAYRYLTAGYFPTRARSRDLLGYVGAKKLWN